MSNGATSAANRPHPAPAVTPTPTSFASAATLVRVGWLFVVLGVALRLIQYAADRALYLDEAALVINVRDRTALELMGATLDLAQTGPTGFLLLLRLIVVGLGESEYALRAASLLFGIATVPLFFMLCRRALPNAVVPLVVALYAFSRPAIYYSSDLKPYAIDLFASTLVLFLAIRCAGQSLSRRDAVVLGVVGAALPWFSQPVAFVLAGTGIVLLADYCSRRDWNSVRLWCVVGAAWVLSTVPALLLALSTLSPEHRQFMNDFWSDGFLPIPPTSLTDLLWLPRTLLVFGVDPLGSLLPGFAALGILGAYRLWRSSRVLLGLLVAPFALTLLASSLHQYPILGNLGGFGHFPGRVALFLVPSSLLLVGWGLAFLKEKLSESRPKALTVVLSLAVVPSVYWGMSLPIRRAESRDLIQIVAENYSSGDVVYVSYGGLPEFDFYSPLMDLEATRVVRGRCSRFTPRGYLSDLELLEGNTRAWVLLVHPFGREFPLIEAFLDRNADRERSWTVPDGRLLLYNVDRFRRPASLPPDSLLHRPRRYHPGVDCAGIWDNDALRTIAIVTR